MPYRVICSRDDCGYSAFLFDEENVERFVSDHKHFVGVQEL